MAYVSESIDIHAPVEHVFALVADPRRALSWLEGFTRFEPVGSQPTGMGARVRAAGTMFGISAESILTIVDFVPNIRFTSESSGPISSRTTWSFTRLAEGTRVTFEGDYRLPFFLRTIGDAMIVSEVGRQTRQSLVNLKALMEADAAKSESC